MRNILKKSSKIDSKNINTNNYNTFEKEISIIKNSLKEKIINDNNEKKYKNVLIIIDFNTYNLKDKNESYKDNILKIDSFIEKTNIILKGCLSDKDKLGVFIYTNQHQIVCPLMNTNEIDIDSFSKDLLYYKNKIFNVKENKISDSDDS